MRKSRYEFFVLTSVIFLTGAVLYGIVGISSGMSDEGIWNIQNPILCCLVAALAGGYFFFSILSGILFTVRWLSEKTFKTKVILTVFFVAPVWLAMAGIFYSLPYGIYNYIQYRKIKEE